MYFKFCLQSRNSKNGFIVSQLPMKNTITDFWRLIYDHGSNIILTLNAPDEDQEVRVTLVTYNSHHNTSECEFLSVKRSCLLRATEEIQLADSRLSGSHHSVCVCVCVLNVPQRNISVRVRLLLKT